MTDPLAVPETLLTETLERPLLRTGSQTVTVGAVLDLLLTEGAAVYIVGGTPRDWLSGTGTKDVDLAVDQPIERVAEWLEAAWPEADGTLFRLDRFGLLRWGDSDLGDVDIAILRSWRDIIPGDMFGSHFEARKNLPEDARTRDFSINAFYYEVRERRILDPLEMGMEDLEQRRLRLIAHRRVQDSGYRLTLRIAQFLLRGFRPTAGIHAYVQRCADRDVQGMEDRLEHWLTTNVLRKGGDPEPLRLLLEDWVREPASERILEVTFDGLTEDRASP